MGYTVSTKMIMCEGKRLTADKNILANEFIGSLSCCYHFMKLNNLSMRVKIQLLQKMPEECKDKILAFHRYAISTQKDINYEIEEIENRDV